VAAARAARRDAAPDAARLLLTACGPRARLWERRPHDPDHLLVRFGTADLPADVSLEDPARPEHDRRVRWRAGDVPVTVGLREHPVTGIAGRGPGDEVPRRLAAWVVAQLAVLQSPRDLTVVVLTDATGAGCWDWVRWLPHARPADGQDTSVLLGTDTATWGRRVAELGALVAARRRAAAASGAPVAFGDVVVVLDGARRLRSLPGVAALLEQGPAVGVRAVCVDAEERLLPEECTAVAVVTGAAGAEELSVRRSRSGAVHGVRPDLPAAGWCTRVGRALAPVRDVGDDGGDTGLPATSRLLDVLDLEPPTADGVAARWLAGGRSTSAVVGESLDGPFAVDLRTDGPHGLVAGTTGSGKSEFLQTVVAALAVANRPDEMTFVLVDYKGGAAFKDCVDLPHTVGMVTDLDPHLVRRALESLRAELRRREHLLADAGAKDLEDLQEGVDTGRLPGAARLPRLVIVIDEFASLVRELPEFVTGLVDVAQRGRSLGIHLLLATQRPGGVVSPEIRANTPLRIALRVTDATEST
ncbi:FtsK/SpoIIIE domain-containing protein, partial [Kineococcus glutinatus]|uniref:FtsK/SpoIIIE domain-containing protein n=1 Tax=Kineococcus glutinatus TaxID=1070872 RepID=UPI0031ED1493